MKELLVKEFEFRVFNESYDRIYKCLSMLTDQQIWQSPNATIPPIGNLILHLSGNAQQWILAGLGDRIDNRKRDEEFVRQEKIKKSDLLFLLEHLKVNLKTTVQNVSNEQLETEMIIQGFTVTGFSILVHVIEHFSYHTGQITTLTKWLTNKDTSFYGGIDLNQLNEFKNLN
ncbi:MAG: DUF1572 family protein [Crocinitomicaceae bacterium]|nr:DUF1572 family protein [Crocinitomicaceae bacterium]